MQVERACLTADEVGRYVDPEASTERGTIANHVDRCEECRVVVAAAVRAARVVTKPAASPVGDAHPGDRVDRYAVFEPLGIGGMGVVYRAYDPRLDRKIAIKLLRPGLCDEKNRERMQREAKMLAKLAHPNVVAVHDAGTWGDRVYIAMELVDGVTLRDWLAERTRPWQEVVDMLVQAGEGLASAHAAGVVHRDIKAQNVLIGSDGRARVGDFGLAEEGAPAVDTPGDGESDIESLTATGALIGTPAYMSPEQLAGDTVDVGSDQFSFAVTAYEALLGKRPFPTATLAELRARFATGKPPELPRTRVPRRVLAVILRGLAIDPAQRFGSMRELVAALRRARGRTHRVAVATVAMMAVLGVAGFVHSRTLAAPAPEQRCTSAARISAAAMWNVARRAELARAFGVHALSYARDIEQAAATRFASYAHDWQTAYIDACRATYVAASQTPATLDLRVACLDDKRRYVDALVTRLSYLDKGQVQAVPSALAALPDLQACSDLKALAERGPSPAHGEHAAEYDRLADELEAINVSRDLGDYAKALAHTERMEPAVAALAHKSLQARYRYIHGELLHHLGRFADAARVLEEAVYLAEAARDQESKVMALVRLFIVASARLDKEAAQRWSRLAEAALDAGPSSTFARAYLLSAQGMYAYNIDDMATAAAKIEQALALARQEPESIVIDGMLSNLASVYYMQERDAEARRLWEETLERAQRRNGPEHPHVALVLGNLGLLEATLGDTTSALGRFERALAIHKAALDPNHPLIGSTHKRIADVLANRPDKVRVVREHYVAAVGNLAVAHPKGHPELTDALIAYAIFATGQRDHRTALDLYERALVSERGTRSDDDPAMFMVIHGLGGAHLELGVHAKAIPLLERALQLRLRNETASVKSLALIERDLARAYSETGKRARASAYAAQAANRLRAAKGNFATELAELDAFVASLKR